MTERCPRCDFCILLFDGDAWCMLRREKVDDMYGCAYFQCETRRVDKGDIWQA